jgi:hypothetical protein
MDAVDDEHDDTVIAMALAIFGSEPSSGINAITTKVTEAAEKTREAELLSENEQREKQVALWVEREEQLLSAPNNVMLRSKLNPFTARR